MSLVSPCEMWVQSHHPLHPLFEALKQHDYPAFAEQQLKERGVDKVVWHIKFHHDFRPILHRMGYGDEEVIVGKIL
jgi:hypothetical protein